MHFIPLSTHFLFETTYSYAKNVNINVIIFYDNELNNLKGDSLGS